MKKSSKLVILAMMYCTLTPTLVFADENPLVSSSSHMSELMFGALGMSLCSIIFGATFIMAKVGKVTWDRFIQIGLYTAGFLGSPSIVLLIKSWVSS